MITEAYICYTVSNLILAAMMPTGEYICAYALLELANAQNPLWANMTSSNAFSFS